MHARGLPGGGAGAFEHLAFVFFDGGGKVVRVRGQCEAEHGAVTSVNKIRRQVPVEDYLRLQRRFAHLFKKGAADRARIDAIQRMADANIAKYGLLAEESRP